VDSICVTVTSLILFRCPIISRSKKISQSRIKYCHSHAYRNGGKIRLVFTRPLMMSVFMSSTRWSLSYPLPLSRSCSNLYYHYSYNESSVWPASHNPLRNARDPGDAGNYSGIAGRFIERMTLRRSAASSATRKDTECSSLHFAWFNKSQFAPLRFIQFSLDLNHDGLRAA